MAYISVVMPPRKWQYIFLTVYYKTLLPLYHRLLCSRPNAQIKIQNLLQILLTFTVQIFIYTYKTTQLINCEGIIQAIIPFVKHKTGISVNVLLQQRHDTGALKNGQSF